MNSRAAYEAWTEHRHFAYRGCAPDVDDPRRAAGNPELSLDAWCGEDRDGAEPQGDRVRRQHAAIEVCLSCPVMVLCDRYANSVTPDGRLAEPEGIRGGRTALERHKAFIRARHRVAVPAPVGQMRTPQKLEVLRALAVHTDADAVAAAAGVPLRTANWQRSRLVTQMNLNKETATRAELLAEAARRGLLEGVTVVEDDGSVPAVPPPPAPAPDPVAPAVAGQLELWQSGLADVVPLHPVQAQEAAA